MSLLTKGVLPVMTIDIDKLPAVERATVEKRR